jgi:hypothetical protein
VTGSAVGGTGGPLLDAGAAAEDDRGTVISRLVAGFTLAIRPI